MEKAFDALLVELGISQSLDKRQECTQQGKVHGIWWNTKEQTASIPHDKLKEMKMALSALIWHRMVTKRALESIAGKMMHWAQLNRASKSLCYNTIHWIIKWIRDSPLPATAWLFLPIRLVNDFKFWLRYLDRIQTVPIVTIIEQPTTKLYAETDASDTHGGVWMGRHWFAYPFEKSDRQWNIALKEAHAVVMLMYNMRDILTGNTVVIFIDNQALFHSVRRKWSPTRTMMIFIYEICLLMLEYRMDIWVEWISSEVNIGADALSRNDVDRFREFAGWGQELDEEEYPIQYYNRYRMPLHLDHDEDEKNELRRLIDKLKGANKPRWWLKEWESKQLKRNLNDDMASTRRLE